MSTACLLLDLKERIYIAKAVSVQPSGIELDPTEVLAGIQDVYKLADYWKGVESRLHDFEAQATVSGVRRVFKGQTLGISKYFMLKVKMK